MALDLIVEWDEADVKAGDSPAQRIPVTDELVRRMIRADRVSWIVLDYLYEQTGFDAVDYRVVDREDVFGG